MGATNCRKLQAKLELGTIEQCNVIDNYYSDVLLGGAAHCLFYVFVVWYLNLYNISKKKLEHVTIHKHLYIHTYTPITYNIQWNHSMKDTLNKGHLSNEDSVCCPIHTELCTNLPLN